MNLSQQLRKYLVMGSQDCEKNPLAILKEAIDAGITSFQFREKGEGSLDGEEKYRLGRSLRDICRENKVLFIVNDDLELFEALDADGIHVGQTDIGVKDIRSQYPETIVGLSVSNNKQLNDSPVHLADYLGAGPIFSTKTKKDANPVVGPEWIKEVKRKHPHLPVVGIGGIHEENAYEVINAGAAGVAVVSAITKSPSINEVVRKL